MKTLMLLLIVALTQSLFPISSHSVQTQKHTVFHSKSIAHSSVVALDETTPEAEDSYLVEQLPAFFAFTFSSRVAPQTLSIITHEETNNSFLKYISLFITSPPIAMA